uniref:Uncharacterized protein n=1 Tax=Knipowitschia caucasica TaxID=637954 RepID=A0AAV2LWL6_KNICA
MQRGGHGRNVGNGLKGITHIDLNEFVRNARGLARALSTTTLHIHEQLQGGLPEPCWASVPSSTRRAHTDLLAARLPSISNLMLVASAQPKQQMLKCRSSFPTAAGSQRSCKIQPPKNKQDGMRRHDRFGGDITSQSGAVRTFSEKPTVLQIRL